MGWLVEVETTNDDYGKRVYKDVEKAEVKDGFLMLVDSHGLLRSVNSRYIVAWEIKEVADG